MTDGVWVVTERKFDGDSMRTMIGRALAGPQSLRPEKRRVHRTLVIGRVGLLQVPFDESSGCQLARSTLGRPPELL